LESGLQAGGRGFEPPPRPPCFMDTCNSLALHGSVFVAIPAGRLLRICVEVNHWQGAAPFCALRPCCHLAHKLGTERHLPRVRGRKDPFSARAPESGGRSESIDERERHRRLFRGQGLAALVMVIGKHGVGGHNGFELAGDLGECLAGNGGV